MSVKILTPSSNVQRPIRLFLAGSIDNGSAVDWQKQTIERLEEIYCDGGIDLEIYNPRDPNWNHSIDPSSADPRLVKQINWELNALEQADVIAMYFASNSTSLISLLETGLHMKGRNLVVYCPNDFHRCTNVRVTCDFYGVTCLDNEREWFDYIVHHVEGVYGSIIN